MRHHILIAVALAWVGIPLTAGPQDPNAPEIGIKITGQAARRIPLAIPELRLQPAAGGDARQAAALIRSVVEADLNFSGLFNVLPPSLYSTVTLVSDRIPFREFAAIGADGVVHGTVGGARSWWWRGCCSTAGARHLYWGNDTEGPRPWRGT